jgi:hypothetical protein
MHEALKLQRQIDSLTGAEMEVLKKVQKLKG